MHPLLTRQLKRLGLEQAAAPASLEAWQQLLERVSRSYVESDQGRELLERSIDLSAGEMHELNEQLRRTSESQLAEERDKLHTVLCSMGDGLCVVDRNWDVVLLNPEGQRLWGLTEAEVVGRRLPDMISLSYGTNLTEPIFTQMLLDETAQGHSFRTDDGILTSITGRSFPVSCVLAPIERDSQAAGAVLVFRDTSERKQAEDVRRHTEHLLRQHQAALFGLTSNSIIQSGVLEPALKEITRVTAAPLGVARCSIWLLREDHRAITCKDLYDVSANIHSSGVELLAEHFPEYFRELLTERVIDASDAQTDSRTSEFTDAYLIPLGIGAMLDIPIRFKGKLVGVLCNEHVGSPRSWMLEEQQFSYAIASLVALALEAVERLSAEGALRTSEARLTMTVQGSHIGIWDWNLTTDTVYFSPQWKNQIGYDDATLPNAFDEWRSRIHSEDQPRVHQTIQSCLDGDKSQFEIEHRLQHRDGSYRWILSRGSLIRDMYGVAARMVGIHIDTTDRKRTEEELRAAKEAAEAASKAKSEFLANMSHEIRTPMNGVLGTTELLLNSTLTDKQRHLASTVHRSGRTLLAIINDILDFSKIEAGKLDLECVEFDLSQLLDESLELFMEAARRKHLRLTQQIDETVPRYLKGDPVRLRQILMNLLGNAMKFTEAGAISLTAGYVSGTPTHAQLRISVTDTGIGIPPAAKLRIFDAFAQADGSTTRRYGGTGLGLSIAKQLVGLMGGAITVESEPGRGSTFSFTARFELQPLGAGTASGLTSYPELPKPQFTHEHSYCPSQPLPSAAAPDANGAGHPSARILVAEDSPVNREVAVGMLELLGYQVEMAENGRQAMELAARSHFDLVLMDCQMPEMDGLTATGKIRRHEASSGQRRLTIIALTANAMQGDREQCLAAGMDDYLTKPYTQAQLQAIVQKWLDRKMPAQNSTPVLGQETSNHVNGDSPHPRSVPTTGRTAATPSMDPKALDGIRALQRPNRPDVLASVLRKYLDNSRDSVDALQNAIRANDPAGLQAVAHRLKSSSAQLGALAVAARCKELEEMGAQRNLIDADRILDELQSAYATACAVFRNEIAKEKSS